MIRIVKLSLLLSAVLGGIGFGSSVDVKSSDLTRQLSSGPFVCLNTNNWAGMSHQAHKTKAAGFSGELISVTDASVTDRIVAVIAEYRSQHKFSFNFVWVGGSEATEDGQWTWTDGSPFTYTNWRNGEPSNGFQEDCLAVYPNGLWNDAKCSRGAPGVYLLPSDPGPVNDLLCIPFEEPPSYPDFVVRATEAVDDWDESRLGVYQYDKLYNEVPAYTNGIWVVFYNDDVPTVGWHWAGSYNSRFAMGGPKLTEISDAKTYIKSLGFDVAATDEPEVEPTGKLF